MEKIANAMEENLNRENMKVWMDYTIEYIMVVIEKTMKVIQSKTINSCWKKKNLCSDVVYDFTGVMTEPVKEIMKEIVDVTIKVDGEGFQVWILEKFKS